VPARPQVIDDLGPAAVTRDQQGSSLLDVLVGQSPRASADPASLPRGEKPRNGPLPQQVALELGHQSEYAEDKLARWRGRVEEAFRERSQLHPPIVQEIDGLNQLQERAAQPVQSPHNDDVALASAVKHSEKFWPICIRTRADGEVLSFGVISL
jgi:hypothetical protein